ncbi:MAG: hypothetical protein RL095_1264 [Verrucomicrobiota bacterium]
MMKLGKSLFGNAEEAPEEAAPAPKAPPPPGTPLRKAIPIAKPFAEPPPPPAAKPDRTPALLAKFEAIRSARDLRKARKPLRPITRLPDQEERLKQFEIAMSVKILRQPELPVAEETSESKPPAAAAEIELPPEVTPWIPLAMSLLKPIPPPLTLDEEEIKARKERLQEVLDSFRIDAQVNSAIKGPSVTRIDIRPAPGIGVDQVGALSRNMAMELRVESLRVLAPVPGQPYVGIEIPNASRERVSFAQMLDSPEFRDPRKLLPIALGKATDGSINILDLAKAPHLLVAGATGSGKSVFINALVASLLMRHGPDELRLVMVDPKVVELTAFEKLPHLAWPLVTDHTKAAGILRWLVWEMERRYKTLAACACRNLEGFNARTPIPDQKDAEGKVIPARLPFIVLIIDELADLMMATRNEVETSLARLAQKSRAIGIHVVVATQRPSVDVLTGVIKANFPTRIAFQVASQIDSRTILDGKGAESLLGRGDLLFRPPGAGGIDRLQGCLVEDSEIEAIVAACVSQRPQIFMTEIAKQIEEPPAADSKGKSKGKGKDAEGGGDDEGEAAELFEQARSLVVRDRKASTSYLQRRLKVGYNRAADLIDQLEAAGVIGPQTTSGGTREILIDRE